MTEQNMLATLMAKMAELEKQQELQRAENESLRLNQEQLKKENERLAEELKKSANKKKKEFKQVIHANNYVALSDLSYDQICEFSFVPKDMDERTAFNQFAVKQALYFDKALKTFYRCIVFREVQEQVQWGIVFLDLAIVQSKGLEIGWKQEQGQWHVIYGASLLPSEADWSNDLQKQIGITYANYLLKNNKSGILGVSDMMIARLLLFGSDDVLFQMSSKLMTTIPQGKLGSKRGRQTGAQLLQEMMMINEQQQDSDEMEEENDTSKKKTKV